MVCNHLVKNEINKKVYSLYDWQMKQIIEYDKSTWYMIILYIE